MEGKRLGNKKITTHKKSFISRNYSAQRQRDHHGINLFNFIDLFLFLQHFLLTRLGIFRRLDFFFFLFRSLHLMNVYLQLVLNIMEIDSFNWSLSLHECQWIMILLSVVVCCCSRLVFALIIDKSLCWRVLRGKIIEGDESKGTEARKRN